jgi:type IV secretion system protein VirB1
MLDLVALFVLAERCAPQVAPETIAAVAWTESRFDPLAIGINRGPRPVARPRTAEEAARLARRLIEGGANIDLGVAQINSANFARLGLTPEAAFDPCRNLRAAATVLLEGYRPTGSSPTERQAALRVALSRYNTGHPERGFRNGYVARVERAAVRLHGRRPHAGPAVPAPQAGPAPARAPEPWDVFARARFSSTVAFQPTDTREPSS